MLGVLHTGPWDDAGFAPLCISLTAARAPPEIRDPFSQNTDRAALFSPERKFFSFLSSLPKAENLDPKLNFFLILKCLILL